MTTTGIIVEFNPFHHGHAAHITETRALTGCKYIVAAMSGNFVQRGEPAICNKWKRTEMALKNGVDVVIEIPLPYVISGADYFARGSVGLLAATGVVDALCFGSECGDLPQIMAAGHVLAEEPPLYKAVLRSGLDKGLSFAAAKGAALEACLDDGLNPGHGAPVACSGLLTQPNNGLAMEYCKALRLLGSPMDVFTTHRPGGGPSATTTRQRLLAGDQVGDVLPQNVVDILQTTAKLAKLDDFSDIFRYLLYAQSNADGFGEGLGNRFKRLCGEFTQISDLLAAVKTKRYTYTRLQRAVIKLLLNVTTQDMDVFDACGGVQYIRVLGFRKEAAGLVGHMVRRASLPLMTHGRVMDDILQAGGPAAQMLAGELAAGDIYRIASGEGGGYRSERGMGMMVI